MRRYYAFSLILALPLTASAQLFSDNFDVDSSANWAVNKSGNPTGNLATFAFDYSTYGIASAPGSGGTTRGLRLQANVTGALFSGLSASPLGQSFTGDYELRANVWMNYLGPGPTGGSGTTQVAGMGIGTAGTTAQWAGGTQDSVHFGTTLDGQSAVDWRAYSSASPTGYVDGSPVFFATGTGNRNNTHAYYSGFGGVSLAAAQGGFFPATQTGNTAVGSAGFAWRDMRITKLGGFITWSVDGLNIARIQASTVTLGGSNILLNHYDTNSTSSTDPNRLNFSIYDNVRVNAVPEPATMAVLGLGAAALLRRRRNKKA